MSPRQSAALSPAPGEGVALDTVFPGASAMAAACRAFDWSATPLGPVAGWSHSLRTTVGTVLTSRQPMFLFWGPALVQLYNDAYRPSLGVGGRADRALGAHGAEFWTEIWDTIGPQLAQVLTTGEATWHEDQHLPIERNGRLEDVWWTYSYSPVRDDDGRIAGVLVVCQETTGRVLAERESLAAAAVLAAERAQLSRIIDQAPAFMAVLRGPEHRFERTNPEYDRLVGGRVRPGLTVAEALPEVVEQGFIELLDGVLATGEPFVGRALPVRLVRAPGGAPEARYVDFVYQALTEADGTRSGIFVHGVDVTEVVEGRRVAERLQALTAAFSEARTPAEVVRVAVDLGVPAMAADAWVMMLTDASGTMLEIAAERGYTAGIPDALRRVPLDTPAPLPEAARTGRRLVFRDAETRARSFPFAAPVLAAYEATVVLPLVVRGRSIGALGVHRRTAGDLGDEALAFMDAFAQQCAQALDRARAYEAERGARAEAEAARAEAEAANRSKAEFLANMSHELRTPLNAIGGYAQLLEMGLHGPVTEDQRGALARVQRAQTHLLALINDVLNYAKLEAGRVEYDVRAVDVRDVVADVAPLIEPQLAAKGLAWDVRLPKGPGADGPCLVWADREKLGQVLVNLLSNATKFTDARHPATGAPGRVTLDVGVRESGPDGGRPGTVFVRVADTGRGIPREKQDAIFAPFVQVRAGSGSAYAQATEGTGLGLAISRDLARGMGGDLRVRSVEGEGSAFTVALRRAVPHG